MPQLGTGTSATAKVLANPGGTTVTLKKGSGKAKKPEIHSCNCGLLAVFMPIPPEGVCVQALIWYHHVQS